MAPALPALMCQGAAKVDAPLSLQTTVMVTSQQVSCPLGDESAILNMKNSVYYGVNPVGATVWNLLKEAKTVGQIRDAILDEYEVDEVRCEKDLFALLEEMRSEGLIEVRDRMTG
jgi:Coenzyme PQQ synthesis protein D (PqqD)